MKYTDDLIKIGLSEEQSRIYEALLDSPLLTARATSRISGVGRELTYNILEKLIFLGLVEKVETSAKVALFRAKHPETIKKLVEEKHMISKEADMAFAKVSEHMVRDYNILHSRPHVRFFEGLEGLNETYKEVLKEAKKIFVFRSLFDHDNEEVRSLLNEHIKKQSKAGIHSYVLSPKLPHMSTAVHTHNLERNITRKIVPKEKLSLPAYIIIYNSKVSITSLRNEKEMVTTIIDNKDIAETFMVLFRFMWDSIE